MEIANNSTVPVPLPLLLSQTYNIYYHLPSDKNWDLKSCKLITSVSTVNELIALNENMNENVIKYCMLFSYILKIIIPMLVIGCLQL